MDPNEHYVDRALLLLDEARGNGKRFIADITVFTESFRATAGHNKLEQIGIHWRTALTESERRTLMTKPDCAAAFAPILHRALMDHLQPTSTELDTLTRDDLQKCRNALRLGIQGILRWRAHRCGDSVGRFQFSEPNDDFLNSLTPVIRKAADTYFCEIVV